MAVVSFKEFSKGQAVAPVVSPDTDVVDAAAEDRPGFFEGVGNAWEKRGQKVQEIKAGDQTPFSKVFQTLGQSAGFIGDTAFEGVKAVTPNEIEDVAGAAVGALVDTEPVQAAAAQYNAWKEQNQEAAGNLEAFLNIGSLFTGGVGGKAGAKVVSRATRGALEDVATTIKNVDVPSVPGMIPKPGPGGSIPNRIGDAITPIEPGVENVLNPTRLIPKEELANLKMDDLIVQAQKKSEKLDSYVKQAERAVSDYSQKTPLQVAGDRASEALTVLQNKLAKQGDLKRESLGEIGTKTVGNIGTIRAEMRDLLRDRVGVNLVRDVEGNLKVKNAQGRIAKIAFDASDQTLIKDAYRLMASLGQKPTVTQIDDAVDALQDLLYKRKTLTAVPVNGQVEAVLKQITGKLNRGVKKVAGEKYIKANRKSAYFRQTFDDLNKALGKEGERGASLMKQLFSPTGEKPRRLFENIKKTTGIDLFEEATLAKFVMENIGDARQASLLEEIIKGRAVTPASFIEKAAEMTIGKMKDPIGKARRITQDVPGFNTVGPKLDAMMSKAPEAKAFVDKLADRIAKAVGGKVAKTDIKGRDRALEKVLTEYGGDVDRITDLARNTVIVPGKAEFDKAFAALKKYSKTENVRMVPPEGDVLGYSGAIAKVKSPNGLIGEVQLNTPWMIYAKHPEGEARVLLGNDQFEEIAKKSGTQGGLGHKYYAEYRSLPFAEKMSPKGQQLAEKSKTYYTSIRERFEL